MEQKDLVGLLGKMTLLEKIGQMTQITGEHYVGVIDDEMVETGPGYSEEVLTGDALYTMGSVIGASSAKVTNLIQKEYLDKSRLKIPLLFMHDAIHGYKTIYPIPLGLSCSWDKDILRKVADYTALELRAAGIHVNFSPMADLVRDSRWGRVMESFGEDHILAGVFGAAMIKGYQKGEDGSISADGVVATLKHFAAYGAPIAGKDYNTVDMSWREFFDYYGKPYEIALKEKPRFVMTSFNTLDGTPVTANEVVMKDILRDKYGFKDLVISDWGAVAELQNHRVAHNGCEAAEFALKAGVDIEMVSTTYLENYVQILKENPDLLEYVDKAVLKILALKDDLGLFENPFVDESKEKNVLMSSKFLEFAKEAAKKSCVLLKNEEQLLPIATDKKKLLVVGPFAKTKELLGNWPCKGKFEDVISLEAGMKEVFANRKVSVYETLEACPKEILEESDYIVLTIGEHWELSGEGHSSVNLELDDSQKQLIKSVKALNKPYTCVAFSGRPLALQDIIDDIPSLLWVWYPGTQGGIAIAELLAGMDTPTGKLTMSFPRYSAQNPIHYNEYSSGRPANDTSYSNRYQDCEVGPLFSFGHGLSYADIVYTDFKISNNTITKQQPVTITFNIMNRSALTTAETAILYIEDKISKTVRPTREMKKWRVVNLQPNEVKQVTIDLCLDDLSYLSSKLEQVVESGEFNIYVKDLTHPKFKISY